MYNQEIFDLAAKSWADKKHLPWAKMRYEISYHFLAEEFNEKPRKILNVGCGDGIESYLLDSFNAEHVLVDYSEEMINEATSFLKEKEFHSKYKTIVSSVYDLESKISEKFDLILFHNVLEYIEDPKRAIGILTSMLTDKGLLSIRHINRYTNIVGVAQYENDLDKVEKYLVNPQIDSSFNVPIMTYTGEEIEQFISENDLLCKKRYGLLSLNNFIGNNEIKYDNDFYEKQKKLEIYMADLFPYYHFARFGLFYCMRNENVL